MQTAKGGGGIECLLQGFVHRASARLRPSTSSYSARTADCAPKQTKATLPAAKSFFVCVTRCSDSFASAQLELSVQST